VAASLVAILGNTLESRATVVVLLGGAVGSLLLARYIARMVSTALANLSILVTARSLLLAAGLASPGRLLAVITSWATVVAVWVAWNGGWSWSGR